MTLRLRAVTIQPLRLECGGLVTIKLEEYFCKVCRKPFSSFQSHGGHSSVDTAKVFSPADLTFSGSLTVKKVMMDAWKGVFHDEIDKNEVKLIREQYRWLNSRKRKDFAELDASH